MDKLREEFEQWFSEKYPLKKPSVRKLKLWEAWRDRRASIVVELPPINIPSGSDTLLKAAVQMAVEVQTNKCADSIRSIGLSIKGE
ncbi:Uncharacterised protein [Serratia entomophila]|uniref:hypothetical protein n=1 Tax=Serratia entomophila TaxID=42906 RepID=UPI00217B4A88|nr:hypothetical protein [Serratia entomophila]CAI0803707.1 Uncharacterised protein [Serratia entomophila]